LEGSRQVTYEKGKKYAESLQMDVLFEEISCKTTPNDVFETKVLNKLAKKILDSRMKENSKLDNHTM